MTLFRKVFSSQDGDVAPRPIRTSYDLAMAPEPDDVAALDTLNEMFGQQENPKDEQPIVQEPSADAVAEAQALLNSAQNLTAPTESQSEENNRNKTRLLGFNPAPDDVLDPLKAAGNAPSHPDYPVGWLVVIHGPGRGAQFPLYSGVVQIGRAETQTVSLNFGDTAISRENHASIAYDAEQSSFFVGHGGKSNIIRLNDKPVLSTESISHGDSLKIGETTLRLATLCDDTFNWSLPDA